VEDEKAPKLTKEEVIHLEILHFLTKSQRIARKQERLKLKAEKIAQKAANTQDEPKLTKEERIALKQQRLLEKAQRIALRVSKQKLTKEEVKFHSHYFLKFEANCRQSKLF
jgi:CRISPR/Cas system CMR-associated protein Cmr3 (group 5 of RAMP superfamily)